MSNGDNREQIPRELLTHLFLYTSNGDGEIPHFNENEIPELKDQKKSGLTWFPVNSLYLRSTRLRPAGELSKGSMPGNPSFEISILTPSIHDIAATYVRYPKFNSEPISCYYELVGDKRQILVVYEGRHRSLGAFEAGRKFILGRFIGPENSLIASQTSPEFPYYFRKPIHPIRYLFKLYKHDPQV